MPCCAMPPLQRMIEEAGGAVTFERFMGFALHDPQYGYYARRAATVGRAGDFSTSATLSPLLARAVAAWAAELRPRGAWHFIELGGGDGSFAREFRRALGWWARRSCRYHFVEIGERLRAAQREALGGASAQWHATVGEALAAADGQALLFGNEFVDALPCAVLERSDSAAAWEEIGVTWPLREVRQPARPELLTCGSTALERVGRVEIHAAARAWLRELATAWRSGHLLLIDYGGSAAECFHRRPRGTLRGYFRQERVEGVEVLERVGHQDLTADVNFDDLTRWAREAGLQPRPWQSQRDFLRASAPPRPTAAEAFLLDENGAGSAFKVLEISAPQ